VLDGRIYVAMPPLYRIDVGKEVYYALDDREKKGILDRIAAEKKPGKANVQRFKGLGEMNPLQLRETTMAPETRRLVQLFLESGDAGEAGDADNAGNGGNGGNGGKDGKAGNASDRMIDMLLSKTRAGDRREWLMEKGNRAETE
jgi:topoisomerase-4 subunit B